MEGARVRQEDHRKKRQEEKTGKRASIWQTGEPQVKKVKSVPTAGKRQHHAKRVQSARVKSGIVVNRCNRVQGKGVKG